MLGTRRIIGTVFSELAGVGLLAFLFYYLSLSDVTGIADVWSVDRVIAYVLLFVAPLLIFWPLSSALRLGPVSILGAGSWALLGYLLIFAQPPDKGSADILTYAAFLGVLFVALGSVLAIPMYVLSARFLPPASTSWVRGLRQGSLVSLFAVSLIAMSPLGVLNWLNVLLVFTIVALTEFFFLARNEGTGVRAGDH